MIENMWKLENDESIIELVKNNIYIYIIILENL